LKKNAGKKKSQKIAAAHRQIASGRSAKIGFLHIPKTGGSGIQAYGKALTPNSEPLCKHGTR
jgi:hypothetical protein